MKNVALVLSSGSSRGMAHIGAIRALVESGYQITSIAGTSMGAIVGGMYAAGKLDEIEQWCLSLDRRHILQLIDFAPTNNSLVKGNKIVSELEAMIPDVRIEDLPIPLTIVATDVNTGKEVLFEQGKLIDAIRASMSLPLFFRPMKHEKHLLVDGGLSNPLPLNRVKRTADDILVSVNVSAPEQPTIRRPKTVAEREQESFLDRLLEEQQAAMRMNYVGVVTRTIDIMIQHNTALATQCFPPDIQITIPMNYYGRFAFTHAKEIIAHGRELMEQELTAYAHHRNIGSLTAVQDGELFL